jgi:hypothetical protein
MDAYPFALDWKPKRCFSLVAELDTEGEDFDPFTAPVVVLDILAVGYAREPYAGRAIVRNGKVVVALLDGLMSQLVPPLHAQYKMNQTSIKA